MKFTVNWLKDHLEFHQSFDELINKLISIGIEVEDVIDYPTLFTDFSVGLVKSCKKHHNADSLSICTVETFQGELQVVCGAPNVRSGLYVAFAPVGSCIPSSGLILTKVNIRGVESCGMILSKGELGLEDEFDGIMELPNNKVGTSLAAVLGFDDILLDISITPNWGHLLSVRGIAKDLASMGFGSLKPLDYDLVHNTEPPDIEISLNSEICHKFLVVEIFGVENLQSPRWLVNRLNLIGLRSINALVDIANYICFDLGQPLHCYDFDKIVEKSLSVDYARSDVEFLDLSGNKLKLHSDDKIPLVSFGKQIGAIAGIKGGMDTACDEGTYNIWLEIAHFNEEPIALAKRALGVNSDSSYRFERGVNFYEAEDASHYACWLIKNICAPGSISKPCIKQLPREQGSVNLDMSYINALSGVEFTQDQVVNTLNIMGFDVQLVVEDSSMRVTPPFYRQDINDKNVIVAEIIRYHGVDLLPDMELPQNMLKYEAAYGMIEQRNFIARRSMAHNGLLETINMSFISEEIARDFYIYSEELVLQNPISEELKIMRSSLIPSLFKVAINNIRHKEKMVNIFEVANGYNANTSQQALASGLLWQSAEVKHWLPLSSIDIWFVKSLMMKILKDLSCNIQSISFQQEKVADFMHPFRSTNLLLGKTVIGYLGELHPVLANKYSIKDPMVFFEIFLDNIPHSKQKKQIKPYLEISNLMPIFRDFAFIVEASIPASDIIKTIKSAARKHITNVEVFDVYRSDSMADNRISLGFTVTLQPINVTFTDLDISEISALIIQAVINNHKGELRDS